MSYSYHNKHAQRENDTASMAPGGTFQGKMVPPQQSQTNHWLHRFLFLWVSLVYIWGILHLMVDIQTYKCWYSSVSLKNCAPLTLLLSNFHPIQALEFTLLLLGYTVLLWAGLARRITPRWYWLSFLLQAGIVFLISLVIRQDNIVLSLYLVLTLEAVGTFQKAQLAAIVASISLLLFVLNEFYNREILHGWATALISIWVSTDYAALSLFLIGYLILYMQLSQTHTQLAVAHNDLSTSAMQLEKLTRLTERQRLARELHDTLSQGLIGLKLQLEAIDALLSQQFPLRAQEIVQHAISYVQATIMQARGAIDDLRSGDNTTHLNYVQAVQELTERFTTATGIPCTIHLDALSVLPAVFHEHVLRVISEGLTNIARHAQATQIWIDITQTDDTFLINVRDNGVGFLPATVLLQAGHYGLLGLRERARMVGGQVEIQSSPGSGTTIRFSLPLKQQKPEPTQAARREGHK